MNVKIRIGAVLMSALSLTGLAAGVATARTAIPTKTTVTVETGRFDNRVSGTVSSPNAGCIKGRSITLVGSTGTQRAVIDVVKSGPTGAWVVDSAPQFSSYTASIAQKHLRNGKLCGSFSIASS